MTVPDTLRERLHKIKALMDGATTDGEREAAENRLNALLESYDITLEDLLEPEKEWVEFRFRGKWQKRLLHQIVGHVTGDLRPRVFAYQNTHTRAEYELTKAQALDVERLYAYYWEAFEDEVSDLLTAFIHKHKLGVSVEGPDERPPMTPEELERWLRLCQLQQFMKDRPSPLAHGYLEYGD